MEQTSKAMIAGVLSIVSGISALIGCFIMVLIAAVGTGVLEMAGDHDAEAFAALPLLFFLPLAALLCVLGVCSVLGGIASVQRRRWALALAGSIAAVFSCFVLGIPAVILLLVAEGEFHSDSAENKRP